MLLKAQNKKDDLWVSFEAFDKMLAIYNESSFKDGSFDLK
jgi:hypothetical protein